MLTYRALCFIFPYVLRHFRLLRVISATLSSRNCGEMTWNGRCRHHGRCANHCQNRPLRHMDACRGGARSGPVQARDGGFQPVLLARKEIRPAVLQLHANVRHRGQI
ncbi:hypothetical protein BRAS3843_1480059 [Bradyrhizobium sp. STM 3843]|nr:hypothetical protein BRAS3843_1480059 [Bradyrhizobium sp. STM 3843]